MPTKAIVDELSVLQDYIDEYDEDRTNTEANDNMYMACARMMSRNKAGIEITKDYLAEIFDYEDIIIFTNGYMDFVNEVVKSKN